MRIVISQQQQGIFQEGDEVVVYGFSVKHQHQLADALDAEFEDIKFYFVEYEDDNAVLSAETATKFAIIRCPLDQCSMNVDYAQEVEELCQYLLIDHALRHRNEKMFYELMNPKEKESQLDIGHVFEEDGSF